MAAANGAATRAVELFITRAGQGHIRAAQAIAEQVRREGLPWTIRQTDILDVLATLDPLRQLGFAGGEAIYNWMLRSRATSLEALLIAATHATVRRQWHRGLGLLEEHWARTRPDLVVSLVPYVNAALRLSLARARPGVPLAVVMLDLADSPPDFWIEPGVELLVCPTARAAEQAVELGVAPGAIRRTSGMVIHPAFYEQTAADRATARAVLGLDPERPTGVVLFGGHGSREMLRIARRLAVSALDVQMVYLCGHNQALARAIEAVPARQPAVVQGFTNRVRDYLALGDFFVGKPGPNSMSEALVMGLPVVVDRNRSTLVQERYNPVWVREQDVGVVVNSFDQIESALTRLLEPGALLRHRRAAAALQNRGVFEVIDILKGALR